MTLTNNFATVEDPLLGFEALLGYPRQAANAIRPMLNNASLDSYKSFLEMMYHYTYDSESKCLHAAELSAENEELKEYFLHMAKEERGHYLLAEKDLEALGGKVDKESKPNAVIEFDSFWYNLGSHTSGEFAGALLVFEGIADHLTTEVHDLIHRLDLSKKQSRWLRVHAEADHHHGAEAVAICRKVYPENPDAVERAARLALTYWVDVFKQAFEANTILDTSNVKRVSS